MMGVLKRDFISKPKPKTKPEKAVDRETKI